MLNLSCKPHLRHRLSNFLLNERFVNQHAAAGKELQVTPQYPPIKDLSFKSRKAEKKNDWYEEIRKLPTIEEKMIKINMPKYYGYKVFKLTDEIIPYNCLPAMQHYTRTLYEPMKIEKTSEINNADVSQELDQKQIDSLVQSVIGPVKDALETTYWCFKYQEEKLEDKSPKGKERKFAQIAIEQIHRALTLHLLADCYHLRGVELDYNPIHEAFWSVGGINPPNNLVRAIKGRKWEVEMADEPANRLMQYKGSPYLALRHNSQLKPWKTEEESCSEDLVKEIPRFKYDPRTLGFMTDYKHLTNIPGFWPGCPYYFPFLSYHSRAYLHGRPSSYGEADRQNSLHVQAIQNSYAWLVGLAAYHGFNTYNDTTYPFNTQTIITDGRVWSFYEYQLNTLLVHSDHVDKNPRLNFCRGTDELQLYKDFDENGQCIDFNPEVLKYLVKLYANAPSIKRPLHELEPYLDQNLRRVANYSDPDKREFLEKTFKHLMSNRPRHLEIPEIYLWEKIYKIDHKTRVMEPKRRFFEVHVDPWKRTLDQHQKEYIPKALRPEGPKSKKKWKQTYYP